MEIDPEKPLAQQLAPQLQHILHRLDRIKKAGSDLQTGVRHAARVRRHVQSHDRRRRFQPRRRAATGDLAIDLTELFVAIGEAAKKRDTAIVLLIDEIQYLQKGDLGALIMALHKISQRQLPLLLFGGGLPQLAKLAGDAKSYAERLFDYPPIGPLDDGARQALAAPAEREDVEVCRRTRSTSWSSRPAAIRSSCKCGARIAGRRPRTRRSRLNDAKLASIAATAALDEGIFKVRLARLTERQRSYARAMAEFGPEPVNSSEVANALGLSLSQAAPIRDELIKKGHGLLARARLDRLHGAEVRRIHAPRR